MKKPLYEPQTGVHRAKLWEIAFFAMNNTSTILYQLMFTYVTYYLTGIVGVGVAFAGMLMTLMRIWDGVTDPIVGFVVDKTNGKFGKNRPFIVIGQAMMLIGTSLLFFFCHKMPTVWRLPFYIVCYMFYIVGYTAQCVVTKSAQTCLTNDPEQRPLFSVFDSVCSIAAYSVLPIVVTSVLVPKYNVYDAAGQLTLEAFVNPEFHIALWAMCAAFSLAFAVMAIIGLWRKDRSEYFGTGEAQMIKLSDYVEVLKNNRAIQMLCVAACSDKLTMNMQRNAVVMTMLFGVIVGNYSTYSAFSGISGVLGMVIPVVLLMTVARKMGQKKALLTSIYGAILSAVLVFLVLFLGDPTQISFSSINLYTIVFLVLYVVMQGMANLASSIVIPMTADCADYEVYRSGRYVPGLMGTLFSFVDKMISSLATTFIGLMLALIGFKDVQPTPSTPYSPEIFWVTMFCLLGAPIIGWILNVVAMHYYPLTKEKMASIQEEIAAIKNRSGEKA